MEVTKQEQSESDVISELSSIQQTALSQVQLSVDIDIGSLVITAKELVELEPGMVFAYEHGPQPGLNLRINGEVVAAARLVAIGETKGETKLGLEILSTYCSDLGNNSVKADDNDNEG